MERSPEQLVHDLRVCSLPSLQCVSCSYLQEDAGMCYRAIRTDAADCIEQLLEVKCNEPATRDVYASYLCMLGIPTVVTGFNQLVEALYLLGSGEDYNKRFMSKLYPDVGKATNSTGQKAERNMRYAISARWYEFSDETKLTYSKSGNVPKLAEFLCTTVECVKECRF